MRWTEVNLELVPRDPWTDLAMVELGEAGYDTFEETTHGLKAYIPSERFDHGVLDGLSVQQRGHVQLRVSVQEVEQRNWNAEWEAAFAPVEVGSAVRIRADFHAQVPGFEHEIVITPRMAFGTGHHATTRLVVEAMLQLDLHGATVCDHGCGTALLAILAEKLGAAEVVAIDIDPGAVENAREIVELNACTRISVHRNEVIMPASVPYAAILANIERNTLVRSMPAMAAVLAPGGSILLSGFLVADRAAVEEAARAVGLVPVAHATADGWSLVHCQRPKA